MSVTLDAKLELPCGAILPNRIAKAAMTEGLATPDGRPTPELERLYGIWSDGGAGMLLSGNIIVDKDHLERPGNVVIDRGVIIPEGLVVGEDPELDAKRFRRTESGICLVTQPMIDKLDL